MTTESIQSKDAAGSYRPKGYGISPGLRRARLRFRSRNIVIGVAVASFTVGVWAYSISAVKQNVFDDVDEEARVLNAAAVEAEERSSRPLDGAGDSLSRDNKAREATSLPGQSVNVSDSPRGLVFAALGDKFPWLFEPIHKTIVWGAPPVDHPGRIQDKTMVVWKK